MSPRKFDADVVQTRLALIRSLLDDLESVGSITKDRLEEERMLRHGVERVLAQVVELAVSVNGHLGAALLGRAPKDYRSSFDVAQESGGSSPSS
jgi:uncharacterized protein YutE (UPF0331/DUF86 family)